MRLAADPDWHTAARELVQGFAELDTPDARIGLMDRLCERLGGSLYPAFLQILCVIERNGDAAARALVTDTLIHALRSGRLPAGRVPAWGAPAAPILDVPPSPDDVAFEHTRSLGPIEYLCAWYAQPSGLPPLDARAFESFATRLLRLISESEAARRMYSAKLLSDAEDPFGDALSRETRVALGALGAAWQRGEPADALVATCLEALRRAGEERLGHVETNPFF